MHVYHAVNQGHPNLTAVTDLVELGLSRFETFSANFTYSDEDVTILSPPVFEQPIMPVAVPPGKPVVEQPPFVGQVAPHRRCGESPWLRPVATPKECASRILAEPAAASCSKYFFVYADPPGDGNCACVPRGSTCSTESGEVRSALAGSLCRIVVVDKIVVVPGSQPPALERALPSADIPFPTAGWQTGGKPPGQL